MGFLFLFIVNLLTTPAAGALCGWKAHYVEWDQEQCRKIQQNYEARNYGEVAGTYFEGTRTESSNYIYNPGFKIIPADKTQGEQGVGKSANLPHEMYIARYSGLELTPANTPDHCNGLKFETTLGGKDFTKLNKQTWLDVLHYNRASSFGMILTVDGQVVEQYNNENEEISYSSLHLKDTLSSQTLRIYFFQFQTVSGSGKINEGLFVVPYFLNVEPKDAFHGTLQIRNKAEQAMSADDLEYVFYGDDYPYGKFKLDFPNNDDDLSDENFQVLMAASVTNNIFKDQPKWRVNSFDFYLSVPNEKWCGGVDSDGFFHFGTSDTGWLDITMIGDHAREGIISTNAENEIEIHVTIAGMETTASHNAAFYGSCATSMDTRDEMSGGNRFNRDNDLTEIGGLAIDPCGVVDIMGTYIPFMSDDLATVRCMKDDVCFSPVNNENFQEFFFFKKQLDYCYSSMPYYVAEEICRRSSGRVPWIDEVHLCCENGPCNAGLLSSVLIWTKNKGQLKSASLARDKFFINENDLVNKGKKEFRDEGLQFFSDKDVVMEGNNLKYTAFIPREKSLQLKIKSRPDNCDKIDLTFEVKNSGGNRIFKHKSWSKNHLNGIHVTMYDLQNEALTTKDDLVDIMRVLSPIGKGYAPYSSINFFASKEFPNPQFNVRAGDSGLPVVPGTYGVIFNTHLALPEVRSTKCVGLRLQYPKHNPSQIDYPRCAFRVDGRKVDCQNGFCESEKICYASSRSLHLEVNYLRVGRVDDTSISLYWTDFSDDSHSPDGDLKNSEWGIPFERGIHASHSLKKVSFSTESNQWKIIPPYAFFGEGSRKDGLLSVTLKDGLLSVRLADDPKEIVKISYQGPVAFESCSGIINTNQAHITVTNRIHVNTETQDGDEIIVTTESDDARFNNLEAKVTIHFERSNELCIIGVDGSVYSNQRLFKHTQIELAGNALSRTIWLVLPDKSEDDGIFVQAQMSKCGPQNSAWCPVGVKINYGSGEIRVYKETGKNSFTITGYGASSMESKEDWGCWIVTTAHGNSVWICPVEDNYLHITMESNSPTSSRGACFDANPNGLSRTRWDGWFDHKETGGYKFCKDDITNIDMPKWAGKQKKIHHFDNNVEQKHCDENLVWTSNLVEASLKETFDVDEFKLLCSRLYSITSTGAAKKSFSLSLYHAAKNEMNPDSFSHFTAVNFLDQKNELLCPNGVPGRNGCVCTTGDCYGNLPVSTYAFGCTTQYSVLIDTDTGDAYRCVQGYCMYSASGFEWVGIHTVHCLNALHTKESTGTKTLWGYSNNGEEIRSLDQGQTWETAVSSTEPKDRWQKAVTEDTHSLGISPGRKGNPHNVPEEGTFQGRGQDLWWLTNEELCLQSSRLAGKDMIYCFRWWCECLDVDNWSHSFGVQVAVAS